MKHIPNLFTLLNLVFGCIAIVLIMQTGETIVQLDATGASQVFLPERIWWGALFLYGAAIVDFLDGFLARAFKAESALGKQLDSLSDMVSFGVAPGLILYQLLRLGYAQEEYGLDVSLAALLPAFIYTCAVAWRLATFNNSTTQYDSFRGVPSPAAGLFIASFPLIMRYPRFGVEAYFINTWLLYGIILALSYLLVCHRRFIAFKFKDYSLKNNGLKYGLLGMAIVLVLLLQWLAVPVIFLLYLAASAFDRSPSVPHARPAHEITDITV